MMASRTELERNLYCCTRALAQARRESAELRAQAAESERVAASARAHLVVVTRERDQWAAAHATLAARMSRIEAALAASLEREAAP